MSDRRVLVVGSYPPIPLPAATATVEAVRNAWADGDEVTVASPRPSAAHLAVPIAGVRAGRRLASLRRDTSACRAVIVVEQGFPVPVTERGGLAVRLIQGQTVRGLVRAFAGFERVTLVLVGALGVPHRVEAGLKGAAHEVIEYPGGDRPPGVTPLGPQETRLQERPQQLLGSIARRTLGPYAGPVRARVTALLRR